MIKNRALGLPLVAMLCIATSAHAQAPADLSAAMGARDSAISKVDAATWDRLTASSFTVVQDDGVMMSKAERLAQLKTQKPTPFTPRLRETVTRYGDTYLARYLSGGTWEIELWIREDGRWKVAAVQITTAKQ